MVVKNTTIPYQAAFSRYYDLLYADKNYAAECDLIESIFAKYGARPRTLLDAGCGSGGHATELAGRGYRVTGVDRSEGLLDIARGKARDGSLSIDYRTADLRSFHLDHKVDACVCMFAVLSFQLTNADMQAALTRLRESLAPGGLFVCDVWNGTAVLTQGPVPRLKTTSKDGLKAWRFATPLLDTFEQTIEVTQHMMVVNDLGPLDTVIEAQTIRYLVPQELVFHLETAGFEVLELFPSPRLGAALSAEDWDIGVVARKRG